jgi:protein-arginine kinase
MIKNHLLFEIDDRFLESAGISRDLPSGRGVFISNDGQFMIWLNEEDHLRIMSLTPGSNLISTFNKVAKAIKILEKKLTFAFDKELGYLSSCPTNIGTTMRASVHIRLPKLGQRADFKELCANLGLQIRGTSGENSKSKSDVFDVSNMQRLGKSEKELLEQLISGIEQLIGFEKELEKDTPSSSLRVYPLN